MTATVQGLLPSEKPFACIHDKWQRNSKDSNQADCEIREVNTDDCDNCEDGCNLNCIKRVGFVFYDPSDECGHSACLDCPSLFDILFHRYH